MTEYVKISNFKTHMGSFLKRIREGAEYVLTDRDHPVAKVTSFRGDEEALKLIPPSAGFTGIPNGPNTPLSPSNVVVMLREDRDRR